MACELLLVGAYSYVEHETRMKTKSLYAISHPLLIAVPLSAVGCCDPDAGKEGPRWTVTVPAALVEGPDGGQIPPPAGPQGRSSAVFVNRKFSVRAALIAKPMTLPAASRRKWRSLNGV